MNEKLELLIKYEEAEWLANTLWLKFINEIRDVMKSQNFEADVNDLSKLL